MTVFDINRAALVLIDLQNDFLDARGAFAKAGLRETSDDELQPTLSAGNRLIAQARIAGRPIVFVRTAVRADHADAALAPAWTLRGINSETGALAEGTWGADFLPGLDRTDGDFAVTMKGHDAFLHTDLDRILTNLEVDQLIIGGGPMNETLMSTIRTAVALRYATFPVREAIFPPQKEASDRRSASPLSIADIEAAVANRRTSPATADEKRSAMVVIDLYEEFLNLDRPWRVPPTEEEKERRQRKNLEIIEKNRVLAEAMRARGWPVIFVNVSNRADALDSAMAEYYIDYVVETAQEGEPFLLEDSASVRVVEGVADEGDFFLDKKGHGGFFMTPLHRVLRNLGVRRCIVTGGATGGCVDETVREGVGYGYDVTLVSDALYPPDSDEYLANVLSTFGRVVTTSQMLQELQPTP